MNFYSLIANFNWRIAFGILSIAVLLIMVPVGMLFFRNKPEDYHLHPDGVASPESNEALLTGDSFGFEENWSLQEAMKTRVFWILIIGTTSFSLLGTGIFFHLVSIFDT